MKAVKGKLLKKLKSIKPIGYLKPDRVLQVNASDGFIETFSVFKLPQTLFMSKELASDQQKSQHVTKVLNQEPDVIDVEELMRDLEEDDEEEENEEMEVDSDEYIDKENIRPPPIIKKVSENKENPVWKVENSFNQTPFSERDILSYRRPDLNSGTLFDPNLLAAFQEAVKDHVRINEAERQARIEQKKSIEARIEEDHEEPPMKTRKIEEEKEELEDPLLGFEEKCPPGGSDSVILYSTTLRGVRKTFEDCNSIRFLLESFRVIFFERDVSMHIEFKEELWQVLEGKVMPPKLFIKGRYIGGADEVLRLHEAGKFRVLFDGIPIDRSIGPCESCAGFRFVVCFKCNGSHRIVQDHGLSIDCIDCNENGLLICPLCC